MAIHQHERRPENETPGSVPEPAGAQHPTTEFAPPVTGSVRVGAVDDVEEVEAESVARDVVAALRGQGPLPAGTVPSSSSGVESLARRAAAPTIGAEGGALDPGAAGDLQALRGGGGALPDSVRAVLEPVMGADLGHVRVHTGGQVDSLNAGMQAAAFTVGSDVFFRGGFPDMSSPGGQRLLAHELAHTLQQGGVRRTPAKVQRFWPFKPKSEEELRAAAEKKRIEQERKRQRDEAKKKIKTNEAEMKAKDKEARANARALNAANKTTATQIKGSYAQDDSAKMAMSTEHTKLIQDFQALLDQEKQVRADAYERTLASELARAPKDDDQAKEDAKAKADIAAENAAELLWAKAPLSLQGFRPLRFDEFDKALNELKQARLDDAVAEQADVTGALQENEKNLGAPLEVQDAVKKVRGDRALERRRARIAQEKGVTVEQQTSADDAQAMKKAAAKFDETDRQRKVGKAEATRMKSGAKSDMMADKYGGPSTTASTAVGFAGTGVKGVGKVLTKGAEKFGKPAPTNEEGGGLLKTIAKPFDVSTVPEKGADFVGNNPTEITKYVGTEGATALSSVLDLVKQIIDFADRIGEIRKGGVDRNAGVGAASSATGMLNKAAATSQQVMLTTKAGLEKFGGAESHLANIAHGLPIVGLIMSLLDVIQSTIDGIPIAERFGGNLSALEDAKLENKGPLTAALTRTNKRNGQLLEQKIFAIAKGATMVGLHVAEIVSAGGFGIPALAKTAISLTSAGHSAGHKIYELYVEEQAAKAKKAYYGGHEEGSARDLVKYDAGTAIDLIIVAAKQHKLGYARAVLGDYGIEDAEIDGMRMQEIREIMLSTLGETGNPKQLEDKLNDGIEKVKSVFGGGSKPGAKVTDDRTLWEKVKAAPTNVKEALVKAKQTVADKYAAAKKLIDEKNAAGYKGASGRGRGAVVKEMLRGEAKSEKSYAKLRQDMAGEGAAPESLPYSEKHKKQMEEKAAAIKQSQTKEASKKFDPKLADRLAKASIADLYTIAQEIDPADEGNLELLQWEIDRRLEAANA